MTEARLVPIFYPEAGTAGHLYDFATSYVSFSPGSYEELEALDNMIWRLLYPLQLIADIRNAEGRVYAR